MLWRAFLLGWVTICLSSENPILSPAVSDQMENNSLELTCYAPQGKNYSRWGIVNNENKFSYMVLSKEGICTTNGLFSDERYFEIKCYSNGTFKVKIKRLAISYHGQEWYCFDGFTKSNIAYINVQVPIKYVKIGNISGNILETVENMKTTLTCKTSAGRPAANIVWIKMSKTGIRSGLKQNATYDTSILESGLTIVHSSIDLKPIRGDNNSRIICEATNRISNITNMEVSLYVQYPPCKPYFQLFALNTVARDGELRHNKLIVKEGSKFTVLCRSDGDPSPKCTWNIENYGTSANLTFTNITKANKGLYECIAENVIRTFPKSDRIKTKSTTGLDIDVLYQSRILEFRVTGVEKKREHFEVTEHQTIHFICIVDSNPVSSMAISFKRRELVRNESTNSLVSIHRVNSCFDNGVYQCSAHNHNNIIPSLEKLTLLVRCTPLLSPDFDLKTNITSAENVTVSLAFKAIAYPEPEFQWYKFSGSSWQALSSYVNYEIKTHGRYSNLSISMITEDDYGHYKLRVLNAVGFLEQLYFLNANGKPDSPTMFKYLPEYVTEASTILQWQPGYDGGLGQTFILRYKLELGNNWTKVILPDTGEQTMYYSLIHLESDSVYCSELFALNSEGKSMKLKLTFKTKAKHQTSDSTMILALVSVSVGTFVFTILAVVVAPMSCKFFRRKETRKQSTLQTAEIIPESQTAFNLDEVNTIHEYEQIYDLCSENREYTEMQTMKTGDDPNRDYITPTI